MNHKAENITDRNSKKIWSGINRRRVLLVCFLLFLTVFFAGCSQVLAAPIDTGAGPIGQMLGSRSQALRIVGLLTVLSLAPSILIMLTGFTRIVIVLSFVRNAMGMQQMPPNQVIVTLALFITFFVMNPVFTQIQKEALTPYMDEQITFEVAVEKAEVPLKQFMLRQIYPSDLNLFVSLSDTKVDIPEEKEGTSDEKITARQKALESLPMSTIVPAFMTSEIKRGFQMGFFIYLPFFVVEMVVASTLMAMGMMMLPPVVISLPFKVLIFILVDGWALTIQSLIMSFG